ncbi:hypothetical protein LOK49_LG05G01489 [Camellia lanceoleosa]|uniref:Uncharacterized protein n=1 Tax=Camellia lanceoleosa TaxID=1840588 RepID=A0ACC0HRU4_9ERIC|nr:hypothetical protein LOK49_LG05G01489 [Camellia lanceoleosa]
MSTPSTVGFDQQEKSQEEKDHLIRSTKKIKSKDSMGEVEMEVPTEDPFLHNPLTPSQASSPKLLSTPIEGPKVKSFKEALTAPKSKDLYFDDLEDTIKSEDEDDDGDTDIQEGHPTQRTDEIPKIALPRKLLQEIRQPWANALIIRLLGKSIGYRLLRARVKTLWRLQDDFTTIDLSNSYFLFKFSSQEDCAMVYSSGPWVIMDHYLTVRKWEPNFKASEAFKTTTIVWVRSQSLSLSLSSSLSSPLQLHFHHCTASDLHRQPLFISSPSQILDLKSSSTVTMSSRSKRKKMVKL